LFSSIGFPHRDDVTSLAPLRPHDNDHPLAQEADAYDSVLAVIKASVGNIDRAAIEDICCRLEIEAAIQHSRIALSWIERDRHRASVDGWRCVSSPASPRAAEAPVPKAAPYSVNTG
jgi:hypothetical protein